MIVSSYSPYPEYKNSGVEWLDTVPRDWIVSKVKYLAPFQVGWTPPTKVDANFIGDNLWANISDLKGKYIAHTVKNISDEAAKNASMDITPKGSLLYSFKLSVGAVSFASHDMYTNEAIASFLEGGALPLSYMYYALPKFVIENASTNIYGARILNQELINNAFLLAPSYKEAEKISHFLDYETAKIDSLIEKQQQLIKLLKEKRQAVISHAITKGLNDNVPMSNSGVDWLGEVPAHWGVKRFKKIFKIRKRISGELGYDILSITQKGIKVKDTDSGEGQLSMDYSKYQIVNIGDFAMNHMDLLTGFVDISKYNGVTSPDYRVFTLEEKKSAPEYFLFYLQMGYINKIFYPFGRGAAHIGRWRLPTEAFNEFLAPCPPEKEQKEISEFILKALEKMSTLEDKAKNAIKLMQERRTALISAAVTGKIDVRNWQTQKS